MNWFSIVLIVILPFCAQSQADTIRPELLTIDVDSAHVSIWDIYFKETSMPHESDYSSRRLVQFNLEKVNAEALLNELKNERSYDGNRSNLSHHDIEIQFFQDGAVFLQLKISALTGNVTIYNDSIGYTFQNNCSESLGNYLLALFNERHILESISYDDINVEGLK